MILNKNDYKRYIKTEKNNYNPSLIGMVFSFFGCSEKNIIWRYQKRLRKWEYHLNKKHKIRTVFYKILTTRLGFKYGLSISPNCFDEGLHITHIGPIIINSNSKIGKNCLINSSCYLVATSGKSSAPNVGDNCILGIGCILIGNITLGNDVIVGAGAVVTKSFENNKITICGVPAKILKSHNS